MRLGGNLAPIFPTATGRMGRDRMAEMYETRGFEANLRTLKTADDILGSILDMKT